MGAQSLEHGGNPCAAATVAVSIPWAIRLFHSIPPLTCPSPSISLTKPPSNPIPSTQMSTVPPTLYTTTTSTSLHSSIQPLDPGLPPFYCCPPPPSTPSTSSSPFPLSPPTSRHQAAAFPSLAAPKDRHVALHSPRHQALPPSADTVHGRKRRCHPLDVPGNGTNTRLKFRPLRREAG